VAIQDRVIRDYAFIPGRLTIAIWPDRLIDLIKRANTDPAALQQARQAGMARVRLETSATGQAARLYERLGFRVIGVASERPGGNGIMMECALGNGSGGSLIWEEAERAAGADRPTA
jgi:hypothetical protein